MIWLLGIYMWLFLHRPFEVWPWLGDLHFERIYMLATIAYWMCFAQKSWIANRLNVALACFAFVLTASWLGSSFNVLGALTVEEYFKVVVFYVLVMSTARTERDLKLLVAMYLGAMTLYMAHSLWEYRGGRVSWRMGTARMMGVDLTNGDPNSFAGTIVYSLPLVFPLWAACRRRAWRVALAGYVGLSATCVFLTSSRMGFVGLCAVSLIFAALSKRRLTILGALAVAAPLIWSVLPADRQNRFLTIVDPSAGPANAQASAEGRLTAFYDGLELWRHNPLLGVGPGEFGAATGHHMQAHNLYGQVLGELGTLGALALAAIVLGIVANLRDAGKLRGRSQSPRDDFPYHVVAAVTTTLVLLLFLGMGGHNLYRCLWLWFSGFQAIALQCLRDRRMADAREDAPASGMEILMADGPWAAASPGERPA